MINNLTEAILNCGKGISNLSGNPSKNKVLYSPWNTEHSETIEDFYKDFIFDRLPDVHMMIKWTKMLIEYSNMDGAVFPVRDGNVSGKLRRGWLVKTDKNFSYMFTDNDLATYVYKFALDGFCPSAQEFFDYMTVAKDPKDIKWLKAEKNIKNPVYNGHHRRFMSMPVHFNKIGGDNYPDKYEDERNSFLNAYPCPVCCLGENNYKHAHIFDVKNEPYCVDGVETEWKNIVSRFKLLGDVGDYKWDDKIGNFVWKRCLDADSSKDLKTVLVAEMLRFLSPINHFLAPKKSYNKYTKRDGNYSLDIAECVDLQNFMKFSKEEMIEKEEPGLFNNYFNLILARSFRNSDLDELKSLRINVVYHEKSLSVYESSKPKKLHTSSRRNSYSKQMKISLAKHFLEYSETYAELDKSFLKRSSDSHGGVSFGILKKLGLTTEDRGLLKTKTLDEMINSAKGKRKETLEAIRGSQEGR